MMNNLNQAARRSTAAKTPVTFALFGAVALLAFAGCEKKTTSPTAEQSSAPKNTSGVTTMPAADNTAMNKGDVQAGMKTPMDQSEAAADIKTTADIRRAIMDDKAMSVNAQNCKIITDKNGMVTLRGAVNTLAEKDAIEAKAKAIAGAAKVDNQLDVKTN